MEFQIEKNIKMANGAASFHSILYFLICLGTMLCDRYLLGNNAKFYFWMWLFIVLTLTVGTFRKGAHFLFVLES